MLRKLPFVIVILTLILGFTLPVLAQEDEDCENSSCVEVAQSATIIGLSEEAISSYEEPQFTSPVVDTSLLHDRRYQQVTGAAPIYDAPNGTLLRTLDAGFNFFTILQVTQDGWTQINTNEWVQSQFLTDTNYVVSEFTGIFLPEEMPEYSIAWMLINAYPSSVPGGNPLESNGLLYRYTRINIYATVELDGWRWYQIGVDKWLHQTSVAKIIPIERPETVTTERWVMIDLYEQVMIAYEGDAPVFATLVSSGLPRWPTFEGTYNIYYRRVRHDMSWGTPGDDFYMLEEVPWTMFFDEGRALHGAYWHNGLGYRRSHGCVNLSITDANWLYEWVAEEFDNFNSPDIEEGPNVYVYSSGEYIE